MLEPINRFLKSYFPTTQQYLRQHFFHPVERLNVELKMLQSGALTQLLRRKIRGSVEWKNELPRQAVKAYSVSGDSNSLSELLIAQAKSYSEGSHSIYFSPKEIENLPIEIQRLLNQYPLNSGLKVVKRSGGHLASYLNNDTQSQLNKQIAPTPHEQMLIAAVLCNESIGPRLWDIVNLSFGDRIWAAFIVEHLDGQAPDQFSYQGILEKLKLLTQSQILSTTTPGGFDHKDFELPDGNGNIISDGKKVSFIDYQSFALNQYSSYLEQLAHNAAEDTHFGNESIFRGGKYLYQEIPGVSSASKRGRLQREEKLCSLFKQSNLELKDNLVLDIGCNLGMMMGFYLNQGAQWCHGWDREKVIPHTERILLATGCTRFSLTAGDLFSGRKLQEDLPHPVQEALPGCIVSYLSIRGHVGWLEALKEIPWKFMIYESHESTEDLGFDAHFQELQSLVPCKVLAKDLIRDGDSDTRVLSIIQSLE